jgi:hypothetical protein
LLEFALVFAQLRYMLAAEDSTVVPQKNDQGRILLPKRTESNLTAARFGKHDVRELRADSVRHVTILFG